MSHVIPVNEGAVETSEYKVFGMVAEYDNPPALLAAVKAVRAAGYSAIDTHTPFPVHGMDKAMGLRDTKLPWVVLCGGLTGTASAVALQWWMNGWDYLFRVGGKPFISYQSYVPIGFELTVLLSALTTVLTLFAMCMLPRPYHPLFTHARFGRFSDDGFFLSVEARDPNWDEAKVRAVLEKAGGQEIAIVRDISET
jgi:hypothetical protein